MRQQQTGSDVRKDILSNGGQKKCSPAVLEAVQYEHRFGRCFFSHSNCSPQSKVSFQFLFKNQAYQFKVLPFGLSLVPRVFTRCTTAALYPLWSRGIQILPYLDEWSQALVSHAFESFGGQAVATSASEGSVVTDGRYCLAPGPSSSATLGLAAGSNPLLIDCEPPVVQTLASARAASTHQLYATRWSFHAVRVRDWTL